MIKTNTAIGRLSKLFVLLTLAVGVILVIRIPNRVQAATGVNEQINYQGRLLTSTGAVVPDGTYNMEFQIIQDGDGCNPTSGTPPCGGTVEWTETRTGSDKVTVKNGYFSVYLGSVTPFSTSVDWNQDTLWLSINIGGTGSPSWDGEMEPFNRLSSTPYALNSKSLGGLLASNFVQLAQGSQVDASTASSIYINKTGASGNILELEKNGSDVLVLDNSGGLSIAGTQTITSASATAFVVGANGGTNPAFKIDASTASSATGISITSKAAAAGVNLSAISSGTNEALSIDAKGSGALNLGNTSTGDILLGGGSGSTGCTVTNSTGAFACTSTLGGSNFSGSSSGTNTGDQTSVSGNAGTATALQTPRTINGVSFDGTANITVTAAAGTLTGATLASGVTASSLTSVGTLTGLSISGTQTITSASATAFVVGANGGTNPAIQIDASTASSATGLKIKSAAAAGGIALSAISSGTDEALSLDAKGAGALNLGNNSTGNILIGGGSGSTGCTVTNSTGAFACTAGLSGTTGTFTSAIAANGGITFDNSTDTVGAFTASGTIDLNNNILTNIGNSGTDFIASTGALTLAGVLTANGGVTVAGGQNLTMSSGSGTFAQTFTGTTTDASTLSTASLTTGSALVINGPTSTGVTDHFVKITTDVGSAASVLNINPDFSGSAVTGYGIYNIGTDSTTNANLDYGYYGTLTLTGNAAKAISGIYQGASTSSTTADTMALINVDSTVTGIITTGTRTIYGVLSQPTAGAESTGGITNVYGGYFKPSADVGAGGTVNSYGLYVANGTYDTDGTSTNTGLYVETPSGADNNYAAIFAGGNVGIGITAPTTKLYVDAGATSTIGLTVNGRIQVNGVAGASATTVCRDGSGVLSTCSSSRAYKKDITYLTDDDYEKFLNDVLNTNVATFYYPDDSNKNTRLGIIAEESPAFLQYTDELGMTNIDFYSYQGGYTWASIHALNAKIEKNGQLILENSEGLEMLEQRVAQLEDNSSDTSGDNSQASQLGDVEMNSASVALDLNVAGIINANGGIVVNGQAQFNGASIFDQLVTFNGPINFNGDSEFAGRATFNDDNGGFALIKTGQTEVRVTFNRPFTTKPVVTLNVNDGQFVDYAYKDLDNTGFTIVLKDPAAADTNFSWSALSIKNARLIESQN